MVSHTGVAQIGSDENAEATVVGETATQKLIEALVQRVEMIQSMAALNALLGRLSLLVLMC